MNKIILILTILVFLTAHCLAQKIEYSLTFAKDTFLVCENILCNLILKNKTSNEVIKVEKKIKWNLYNQNNEPIALGLWHLNRLKAAFNRTSNPGEEIILLTKNILHIYGQMYSKNALNVYIPAGKYLFEFIISEGINNEIIVVDSFWVKTPSGDESYVLTRFVELVDKFHTPEELNYLVDTYPNSVYTGEILNHMLALYMNYFNDPVKYKEVEKILVEDYPTSTSTMIIKKYLKSIKDPTIRAEIFNKIKMKVKGTMFEKFYEQELKEFEEK